MTAAQKSFRGSFVADISKTYLSLYVNSPIFLSHFIQIWSLLTDFHKKSLISDFTAIQPGGAALIATEELTGRRT